MSAALSKKTFQLKSKKYGSIAYESICDSDETIIMLRGWTRCSDHWLDFEKKLIPSERKIILLDLPGFGKNQSIKIEWKNTIEDYADFLFEFTQLLDIKKLHLFSISLGAMVALQYSFKYSQGIESLCLINTSMNGGPKLRIHPKSLGWVLWKRFTTNEKDFYHHLASSLLSYSPDPKLLKTITQAWLEIDQKYPLKIDSSLKQLLAAMRFGIPKKILSTLKIPCLIFKSLEDQFVPNNNSDFIHQQIPNSILVEIPKAGHEATLEQGDYIANHYLKFLQYPQNYKKT